MATEDELAPSAGPPVHAIAEIGEPALEPDFAHFRYAEPEAPKGGTLRLAASGSFDSLNDLPLQGLYPRSLPLIYDTLMAEPQDELSVYYPLIAESVELAEDLSWMVFNLRPEARFHDGEPITAEDVAWTFEQIREHGRPFLKSVYEDVTGVDVLAPDRVRFRFATTDTMAPLVRVAGLTVRPRHWWTADGRAIGEGTLDAPLGSGPYRLETVDAGRRLEYRRVEDYWAADLPVNRGLWNFDRVTVDYYLDTDVMFEGFRGGAYDYHRSFSSRQWATGFDLPAVDQGHLVRETLPVVDYRGVQGFFFNIRNPLFADRRVRRALTLLFNFEFVNETIMYGLYERMESYFPGSPYAARGLPEGEERALLEQHADALAPEVLSQPFALPTNQGARLDRDNLREALALLAEAGWVLEDGRLVNGQTGEPFRFALLMRAASGLEPHASAFAANLRQAGITLDLRPVDAAQWQARYQDRDFEAIIFAYTFFPPPGSQLANRFSSAAAEAPGSANLIGIADPVVDALLRVIVPASDPETKIAATRALDRVLLWGYYVIPHWFNDEAWIAYWDRLDHPAQSPPHDFGYPNSIGFQPTWWFDPEGDRRLREAGR
jgi:microcin C transport system substrate-binding protein